MKILYINSLCGVGSTGRIITDLAFRTESYGHQCFVAYGLGKATNISISKTRKICTLFEYKVSNLFSKLTGLTGCFNVLSTRRLKKYICEVKPDVIHIHNIHGYYVNPFILLRFIKQRNIPIVLTLHDCYLFTGNCAHYSYVGCKHWMYGCGQCVQKRRYPKSYFFDFSAFLLRKKVEIFSGFNKLIITTPSKWLASEAEKSFFKQYRIIPIYNGCDTKIFQRKNPNRVALLGEAANKKIILGVASAWSEKKGLADFIRLSAMLPSEFVIILIGLDPGQKKNLPDKIIGIERTTNIDELAEYYSAAYVFVNPSYEETFGLVTLESMLCGTPVITYDKTAVPEIVNEENGIVVEAGNVDALCNAILSLPDYDHNSVRASAMKYSKEKMTEHYLQLYQSFETPER